MSYEMDYAELEKVLSREQIRRYKKEMLSEEEIKDEIPLQKLGECEDIARCIKWLIEDKYVTGQIIAINGGWSIT